MMESSDQQFIDKIKQGNIAAFEELYKQYYIYLCLIAEHIIGNSSDAEEIVSDVFVRLWNIREKIDITTSVKSYLVRAVHNTSINYLNKFKLRNRLTSGFSIPDYELLIWDSDYPLGQLYEKEIIEILEEGISELPEACRQVFLLSRNEDMRYIDIAEKLGISVNTVKTQVKIALARLREILKDYLVILFLFIGF